VTRIGVISDTHGLMRPEALEALAGVDAIVHAGDIGAAEVLEALARIAPVTAVRGNNDRGDWAAAIPETATLDAGGAVLHVIHDVKLLDCDPRAAGFAAVVAGHSHKPRNEVIGGVLWFNPGAAGPRRFSLPVSVGLITCRRKKLTAELVTLDV
jgi:putative phosphoesterase